MKQTKTPYSFSEALLKSIVKAVVPTSPTEIGEGWPWCTGILYQPKHPMLTKSKEQE